MKTKWAWESDKDTAEFLVSCDLLFSVYHLYPENCGWDGYFMFAKYRWKLMEIDCHIYDINTDGYWYNYISITLRVDRLFIFRF